jgi:hypothetical protein
VYSYAIAFPELVLPVKLFLKRFAKKTHIHRMRKQVSQLIDKLDNNTSWIIERRNAVTYAPRDLGSKGGASPFATFKTAATDDKAAVLSPLARYLELQGGGDQLEVSLSHIIPSHTPAFSNHIN